MDGSELYGKEKVSKILIKTAPPVMIAQLIQALYNIVDSFFVGKNGEDGLTALSIVYPLQLLMIALAVGSGVGVNTVMAARLGVGRKKESDECAGVGTPIAFGIWLVFAILCFLLMPAYARVSTDSSSVINEVIIYGRIVCVFSVFLFLESVWTKILQARGDMKTPMTAQIIGAIINIALDPLLIFGWGVFPKMGIAGAAVATVLGQMAAALVVMKKGYCKPPERRKFTPYIKQIFKMGTPNILMQSAYTFYIFGLNLILSTFSDAAVTVLGLYYKWQTFFFIPLGAMQTCIVPIISFNYAAGDMSRCKKTMNASIIFGAVLMFLGTLCFAFIPVPMLKLFSSDNEVLRIGAHAFPIIGLSFAPMVTSLTFPVFFQAVGSSFKSSALTVFRTVILFVPLGYLLSRFGLGYFWLTYPITDSLSSLLGLVLYIAFLKSKRKTQIEEMLGKH